MFTPYVDERNGKSEKVSAKGLGRVDFQLGTLPTVLRKKKERMGIR